MNKAEFIEALAARLGDKKRAVAALDAVLAEIQAVVTKGDKVAITGFGVFEKRTRAARTARNPRTGEPVKVKKTSVPAFRAGATFREMVASEKAAKKAAVKSVSKTATKMTSAKATGEKATISTGTRGTSRTTGKAAPAATKTAKVASKAAKAGTAKAAPAKTAAPAAKAAKTSGRVPAKATATKAAKKR